MKSILLMTFIIALGCSSEPEPDQEKVSDHWKYVNFLTLKPKIEELNKRKPALLNESQLIRNRLKVTTHHRERLLEIDKELELIKLWEFYQGFYVRFNISEGSEKEKCRKNLDLIKKHYKRITGQEFPDVEKEFEDKYGEKLRSR